MRAVWVVEVRGLAGAKWHPLDAFRTRAEARKRAVWRRVGSARKWRVVKYVPAEPKKRAAESAKKGGE